MWSLVPCQIRTRHFEGPSTGSDCVYCYERFHVALLCSRTPNLLSQPAGILGSGVGFAEHHVRVWAHVLLRCPLYQHVATFALCHVRHWSGRRVHYHGVLFTD